MARNADAFCRNPQADCKVVLVYGPDQGLVRERSDALVKSAVTNPDDPFQMTELDGDELRSNPDRLASAACAMSMIGERQAVRVKNGFERLDNIVRKLLELPTGDTLVVIEAGELGPRASLRATLEKSNNAAVVACYRDEGRALESFVRTEIERNNIRIERDAMLLLISSLGNDRMQSRSEIAKLALYTGVGKTATLADVEAAVSDASHHTLEGIAHAAMSGNLNDLERTLERAFADRESAVTILIFVRLQLARLNHVLALLQQGKNIDDALRSARILHFRVADQVKSTLRLWDRQLIDRALEHVLSSEIDCKTTGVPGELVCRRTLYEICMTARRRTRPAQRR